MSEQKWTKEPWDVHKWRICAGVESGNSTLVCDTAWNKKTREVAANKANAARIVACVNALAGIPDPAAFVSHVAAMERALRFYADPANMESFDVRKPGICKIAKQALEGAGDGK